MDRAILEAAIALFAERGVEGVNFDQIARDAGVSRASIYRRWRGKKDLLVDALGALRRREEPVADWSGVDAPQFAEALRRQTRESLRRPDLVKLTARLLGESQAHPDLIAAYWETHLAPRRAAFAQALGDMQGGGTIALQGDPEVIQDMIAGALLYRFLLQPGPRDAVLVSDYVERLLGVLGLASPALPAKRRRQTEAKPATPGSAGAAGASKPRR